jgi:CMP-N,N'-diacetyllegionaminic acid synthase
MKILGVIPARGGSKRLPRKNLLDLGGKSLVKRCLDTSIKSDVFDHLWVSTEDPEIGAVAGEYWWKRPPELAKDNSSSMSVLLDVFARHSVDITVLIQPTSPFLMPEDIRNAVSMLKEYQADSVISTVEASKDLAFQIRWASRLESIPNVVVPNGALYLLTSEALNRGETWYSGRVYGYQMPKDRSIDVDTQQDLEIARHLLSIFNGQC